MPYVECDPKGISARPDLCQKAGVRAYPTWTVGSERVEGVLSLGELGRLSRFRYATTPAGG